METLETKSSIKVATVLYVCETCDYISSRKNNYDKHITTPKHHRKLNGNEKKHKSRTSFNCTNCGKSYYTKSGIWKHKKMCDIMNKTEKDEDEDETINYKELLLTSIKQNKELQDFIIKQSEQYHTTINEIIPKIGNTNNTNNTNNTINNNQKLNINIFLNEQCKDAITMDEFINKMHISLKNLFYTRDKGIAEGVSNIFIENLNKLPLNQRPIHCTDPKRETIYIKNEQWEKDEDKLQTKEVIKKVSYLQVKNIKLYKEAHPQLMENQKEKDDYMEIIKATTDDVTEKEDKILKNICKSVYISNNLLE